MRAVLRRFDTFWNHRVVRGGRRLIRVLLLAVVVLIAVALVTAVTVDLGPTSKQYAEKYGSDFLERPLTIGRISFRLFTGNFVFEDLRIGGITAESRPFLVAKRVELSIPWSTLFNREFVLESIEMTDWDMHVEVLRDGRHSLPKLTPRGGSSDRPKIVTTTVRWVRAHRGQFTFQDHATPWSVITRNLDVTVAKPGSEYRGQASFTNGTVAIQEYIPFRADMRSSFKIDGSRVILDDIELISDGARSSVRGDVNLKYWPEQMFRVESTIDLKRMRELFFAKETFTTSGVGRFEGYFHLFKEPMPDGTNRTGRELFGTFTSARTGVNTLAFNDVRGRVRWTPSALTFTEGSATLYGGRARFDYTMAPLGVSGVRPTARFTADFAALDLMQLSEFARLEGLRLAGTTSGDVDLTWPIGRFSERRIAGHVRVEPPDGVTLMTRDLPVELIESGRLPRGLAAPLEPIIPLAVGADLTFSSTPGVITLGPSRVMTGRTYVEVEGTTTTTGEDATLPFFVASADWHESYRVFADVMTALGVRTTTVDIAGYGTFAGVLTENVRRPRIEGTFTGERMRAWDVEWGSARGRALIENGYADIRETTVTAGTSTIEADGRFSLGFPRSDGGEELNARVRLDRRPIADLRHAFGLDTYPVDGLLSGEFQVSGEYRRPRGYGEVEITQGEAYGETFTTAQADVALEGVGIRLTGLEVLKGSGRGSGAAYVAWDGSYSFDFAGTAIPVEDVNAAERSPLPLSGLVDFTATGSGTFEEPRYTVNGHIRDFFAADEGIGEVVGQLSIAGDVMTVSAKAASPRLAVSVDGSIELTSAMHSDLLVVVTDTSLDPYVRAYDPRLSPYTTALVSGTVRVRGELTRGDALEIDTEIDSLRLRLFDYTLQNAAPFRVLFDRNAVSVPAMTLFGEDTKLEISGAVSLATEQVLANARGAANLALLQGVVSNVRSSGNAVLAATVTGSMRDPDVTGSLRIDNGRIRHFGAPHALENINGALAFDTRGVTLDGLTARLGGGPVQFGGRIEKVGYLPGRIEVTMAGQNMRLRYPAGMQSLVDADLTLEGTVDDMHLGGDVVIRNALYTRPFPANLFELLDDDAPVQGPPGEALPLTYDGVRITGMSSIRVQNTGEISARISASADLELHGTYAQPVLSGYLELDPGGEMRFSGKRYTVTRGIIDFVNPDRIEPTFDLEAETRVRAPGETYRITVNLRGTCCRRLERPSLNADPALSEVEILALLFGDVAPGQDRELVSLQADSQRYQQIVQEIAARQAASPISSQVDRIFRQAFGVDAVELSPSITNPNPLSSRLEPCARLQVLKRLSARGHLTYSRSQCSNTRDEIIYLEYDVTDRFSWVLSRNEDQTYAIEVRVRRSF